MGQNEIVGALEHDQLMLQAVFALTQRVDPTPYCRHALANIQVEPLHKRRIDLPATHREDLRDGLTRAEDNPVLHPNHASTPVLLDHLGIQEPRNRHPARRAPRAFVVAARGVNPPTKVTQDGRPGALEPIGTAPGHTGWGYASRHL